MQQPAGVSTRSQKRQRGDEEEEGSLVPKATWTEKLEAQLKQLLKVEHMTHKEIAAKMGMSENHIRGKINSMKKAGKLGDVPSRESLTKGIESFMSLIPGGIPAGPVNLPDSLQTLKPTPVTTHPITNDSAMNSERTPTGGISLHSLYVGDSFFVLIIWKLPQHQIRCNFQPTNITIRYEPEKESIKPKEIAEHLMIVVEEFIQGFFEQGLHHPPDLAYSVTLPKMITTTHSLMKRWESVDVVTYLLPFEKHQSEWF